MSFKAWTMPELLSRTGKKVSAPNLQDLTKICIGSTPQQKLSPTINIVACLPFLPVENAMSSIVPVCKLQPSLLFQITACPAHPSCFEQALHDSSQNKKPEAIADFRFS
ncbi:hypothetical protein Cflav_PD3068 [Pedosphaera parvula Ellin514]|uniref:Uncharacterized protein n=1 Tax=Pedosphaera parvula (strain Ellin514) TaxID=320771 RepID=B9XJE8_PEDPL|nr:hypothetical protein Cflav_PD3068 [Pedosphaera parvula Ellin514]